MQAGSDGPAEGKMKGGENHPKRQKKKKKQEEEEKKKRVVSNTKCAHDSEPRVRGPNG